MKKLLTLVAVIACLAIPHFTYAPPPPGGGGGPGNTSPVGGAPIDGALFLLAAGGIAIAAGRKALNKK